jgi:plastocyanin
VTVFYVFGPLTAAWALLVAAMGIRRQSFPTGKGGTRLVMAISVTLVAGSVLSAVIGGALEEEEEEAEAAAEEPAPAPVGGEQLELSAVPSGEFAFDTDSLEAEAGPVTITLTNPAPVEHNVSLEDGGVAEEGETVGQGGTSTVTAELDRGDYAFYCSVPGHREGGMEGELTVR